MSLLESKFCFKDRVVIDGDTSLVGSVTGMMWNSAKNHTVEVSWVHNGVACSAWIQDWRLTLAAQD